MQDPAEQRFCRRCVWHFVLSNLVGCEYHLCNDRGRGHPGGVGCPKFLRGNPKIRHAMVNPTERNVRIRLGLDKPPETIKTQAEIRAAERAEWAIKEPRPYSKAGTRWPPTCYIEAQPRRGGKATLLDMEAVGALIADRGGAYGLAYETGIYYSTVLRWVQTGRINRQLAERLRMIYGVDVRAERD